MKTIDVRRTSMTGVFTLAVSIMSLSALVTASTRTMQPPTNPRTSSQKAERRNPPDIKLRHAELPWSFEPNLGQTGREVKFLSRGMGRNLYLTADGAVLQFEKAGTNRGSQDAKLRVGQKGSLIRGVRQAGEPTALTMRLVGANRDAAVNGLRELPGRSNYFIGSDAADWRTNVPHYSKVRYEDVYPGVDLVYYGKESRLEYDFVIAPGADPDRIRLAFQTAGQGASNLLGARLSSDGDLVIDVGEREVRFGRPIVYQPAPERGRQIPIKGRYVLTADNQIGFEVGPYDRSKSLVIDPVLSYSTYLGGNDYDQSFGIAVDASGNILLAGTTASTNFPTADALQSPSGGGQDVFVTKFDPSGTSLLYSTYVGGKLDDACEGLVLDPSGNAYVTGFTTSQDFPTKNPIQSKKGPWNVLLFQLDVNGNLVFSTYYGGSGIDQAYGLALDSTGVYVVGNTTSSDYPTKNAFQTQVAGGDSAFLTKFSTDGTSVIYSTYLGGAGGGTQAWAVAVDSAQSAYVTGQTHSPSFPLMNPFQGWNSPNSGSVFLTKFTPTGDALVYSTYLGGTNTQSAGGVFVDSSGNAYVSGGTASSDFPTANAYQSKLGGNYDAFVAKFNPSGSALVYSTLVGGSDDDFAAPITVDSQGNAYAAGYVLSTDFPTTPNAFQPKSGGDWDAFIFELNSAGNNLIYASYLGGSGTDVADTLTVDSSGNIYLSGTVASTNFPVTSNAFQSTSGGGGNDAYLAIVSAVTTFPLNVTVAGTGTGNVSSSPTGINCGSVCSATFATGTVALTANTATGSTFTGWSGACSGTAACNLNQSSNSPVNVTATFDLPDFSLTPASTTMALQGGGQGTDTITIAAVNGTFGTAVQLTCSVTGPAPTPGCGLSPTSVTPGATSGTSTLTVTAPARASRALLAGLHFGGWFYGTGLMFTLGIALVGKPRRRRVPWILCGVFLLLSLGPIACSSGNSQPPPPKNFTVSVTGTSGTIQHTTSVAVTVQ